MTSPLASTSMVGANPSTLLTGENSLAGPYPCRKICIIGLGFIRTNKCFSAYSKGNIGYNYQ
jgi:hypothetical protein